MTVDLKKILRAAKKSLGRVPVAIGRDVTTHDLAKAAIELGEKAGLSRVDHLFIVLAEEAAEVSHAVAKILRFGKEDRYPGSERDNAVRLNEEFNDLVAVVELLRAEGIVIGYDEALVKAKKERIERFLRYSKERGR